MAYVMPNIQRISELIQIVNFRGSDLLTMDRFILKCITVARKNTYPSANKSKMSSHPPLNLISYHILTRCASPLQPSSPSSLLQHHQHRPCPLTLISGTVPYFVTNKKIVPPALITTDAPLLYARGDGTILTRGAAPDS